MGKIYRQQVSLLLSVLPEVAKEKSFALHGGTAINFGKSTQIDPLNPNETDPPFPFQIDPLFPAEIDPLKNG
jgi:hypothetical protein